MDIPLPRRALNPRQERFCHYFALYANALVAAQEAGYSGKSAKHQGYRLLRTDRVRHRIRAIHAEHAHDFAGGADAMIGKLEAVYRRAIHNHHFHTAARCVELQARLAAMKNRKDPLPVLPTLAKASQNINGKPAAEIFAEAATIAREVEAREAEKSAG